MRHLLTFLLITSATGSSLARPAVAEGPHTTFVLQMDGGISVPVRVNGAGPFRFRLDTGASRTVVTDRLVDRLGLPSIGETVVVTHAGRARRPLVKLERLTIVDQRPLAVPDALMLPARDLDPAGRIDGLVGGDALGALAFTIDYGRRRIVWHDDPVPDSPSGVRVPLELTGGRATVTLPQRSGSRDALRMVPDTGADALVLLARPGRVLPLVTPLDTVQVRGVAGSLPARRVLVQNLDVGNIRLADQVGLLVDGASAGSFMGDGLLPLHLFTRVTFNGPGGYAIFDGSE
ncbi:MAG: aspartyl protease family protein [Acidobacteria bacterium]|nr:aspartyl protease family protein [Acidobacteriota bacterium]